MFTWDYKYLRGKPSKKKWLGEWGRRWNWCASVLGVGSYSVNQPHTVTTERKATKGWEFIKAFLNMETKSDHPQAYLPSLVLLISLLSSTQDNSDGSTDFGKEFCVRDRYLWFIFLGTRIIKWLATMVTRYKANKNNQQAYCNFQFLEKYSRL